MIRARSYHRRSAVSTKGRVGSAVAFWLHYCNGRLYVVPNYWKKMYDFFHGMEKFEVKGDRIPVSEKLFGNEYCFSLIVFEKKENVCKVKVRQEGREEFLTSIKDGRSVSIGCKL